MTAAELQREAGAIRDSLAPAVAELTEAMRGIVEALGDPTAPGAADRIVEARELAGCSSALLGEMAVNVERAAELAERVKAAGLAREGSGAPALWRFRLARRLLRRVRVGALAGADPAVAEEIRALAATANAMHARVGGPK